MFKIYNSNGKKSLLQKRRQPFPTLKTGQYMQGRLSFCRLQPHPKVPTFLTQDRTSLVTDHSSTEQRQKLFHTLLRT
jgi:hypothetical protein